LYIIEKQTSPRRAFNSRFFMMPPPWLAHEPCSSCSSFAMQVESKAKVQEQSDPRADHRLE
jgi:hypothetical protein